MSTILIQNGTIVNADASVKADLLIDGTMIKEVRAGIPASAADKVVDATGLLCAAGRDRRAYASRYAVWRVEVGRRF